MAHARRKIHDVHARVPTDITTEALQRIGELYAIEAEVRGCTAEQRLAARKARAAPLMQSLYDWIQTQMKTLCSDESWMWMRAPSANENPEKPVL